MIKSQGHLNPGDAGVTLERRQLGLDSLVRHVWIARWDLPEGVVRPQRVLTYPTSNIVITPDGAFLHGPDPAISIRELSGSSWAVGILLRPAGASVMTETPATRLVGGSEEIPGAPIDQVGAAMSANQTTGADVAAVLRHWLAPFAEKVDESGHKINEVCLLAEERDDVVRVSHLAELANLTTRTLSRLVQDRIGVTPKWLIECRRLQQAATTLYTRTESDLASLAHDLGYSDQAHFTRRYRQVLGETPNQTRRAGADAGVQSDNA